MMTRRGDPLGAHAGASACTLSAAGRRPSGVFRIDCFAPGARRQALLCGGRDGVFFACHRFYSIVNSLTHPLLRSQHTAQCSAAQAKDSAPASQLDFTTTHFDAAPRDKR